MTRAGVKTGAMPTMKVGDVIPLEQTCCKRVLNGRLPEFIPDVDALAEAVAPRGLLPGLRGHVMTPVVLKNGRVYGTLCCLSASPLAVDQERALLKWKAAGRPFPAWYELLSLLTWEHNRQPFQAQQAQLDWPRSPAASAKHRARTRRAMKRYRQRLLG